MTRVRISPLLGATLVGLGGGLVFASMLLLLIPPTAGIGYWGPVAIATAVSLAAAFGSQFIGSPQQGEVETAAAGSYALSFSAAPPGGLLPTADAMIRFDEELRLAAEYQRPLCLALMGLDSEAGVDSEDALEALRQLAAGAIRRHDVVTDRGGAELLLMLLETSPGAGWVVVERVHQRVSTVGIGALRCVLLVPPVGDSLGDLLDELDSGLRACREMNLVFANPNLLLAKA
jgi:hypothetical protein